LAGKISSCFEQEEDVPSEYYRNHRFIALFAILVSSALIIIMQLIVICSLKRKNTQLEARLKPLNIPTAEVERSGDSTKHTSA
jgi:hypothetical protein